MLTVVQTKMKPRHEQFIKDRAGWLDGVNLKGQEGFRTNEGAGF